MVKIERVLSIVIIPFLDTEKLDVYQLLNLFLLTPSPHLPSPHLNTRDQNKKTYSPDNSDNPFEIYKQKIAHQSWTGRSKSCPSSWWRSSTRPAGPPSSPAWCSFWPEVAELFAVWCNMTCCAGSRVVWMQNWKYLEKRDINLVKTSFSNIIFNISEVWVSKYLLNYIYFVNIAVDLTVVVKGLERSRSLKESEKQCQGKWVIRNMPASS